MPVQLPVQPQTNRNNVAPTAGSTGRSIIDIIPLKMVLWLASPYLAGRSFSTAIDKSHELYKQSRYTGTIDILGEDCTSDADCNAFVRAYKQTIDAVAARQLPVTAEEQKLTVSFKPSMFSVIVPTDQRSDRNKLLSDAYDRMEEVVAHAKQRGVRMTLEAEDHRWTDFHLDCYFALLKAGYSNLGTVLQSRLFRTRDDLKRFDESTRVRMVIGIYNEPADIALTDKPKMKEVLVDYAAELAARGAYIEVATHDSDCVDNFIRKVAIPQRVPSNKFEMQFLLGVPRKDLQQSLASGKYFANLAEDTSGATMQYLADLARTGVPIRMYLPFGQDAVAAPYCKRRLKANPNMITYGIKNFLHLQ